MADTKIEWATKVWNPVTGCKRVSPGCDNCYAIRQSHRFSGFKGSKFEGVTKNIYMHDQVVNKIVQGVDWSGVVRCHERLLELPFGWAKPQRIFVNSMSDLFHDDVPEEFIFKVWKTMLQSPGHTYMILTKRPQRMKVVVKKIVISMRDWLAEQYTSLRAIPGVPWRNVWLGVSCENQAMADQRIPHLLNTPAAVRFVSCEPMLGGIDLNKRELLCKTWSEGGATIGTYLDWVICGGESGPKARPMHPDWVRSVRDQCVATSVPFFFKQHGEWLHESQVFDSGYSLDQFNDKCRSDGFARVGKKVAGRLLDGREWNEFPRQAGTLQRAPTEKVRG